MAGAITANIVVNFSPGDEGGILVAEIDDRPDGLNQGITSFAPGDEVGFLIFKSSNVTVQSITATAASISARGSQTKEVEDILTFAKEREASVRYPIANSFTSKWLGNSLGGVTFNETTVSVGGELGIGVLKVEYNAVGEGHKLINVPKTLNGESTFAILIFVEGTVE